MFLNPHLTRVKGKPEAGDDSVDAISGDEGLEGRLIFLVAADHLRQGLVERALRRVGGVEGEIA
jgi:hypothetical protein